MTRFFTCLKNLQSRSDPVYVRFFGLPCVVFPSRFYVWTVEYTENRREASSVVVNILDALDVQVVVLVRLVRRLQLAHHYQEDDAGQKEDGEGGMG